MALWDGPGDGEAVFENSSIPCRQCFVFELILDDDVLARFTTYQNDSVWGLWMHRIAPGEEQGDAGNLGPGYRTTCPDLPVGAIDQVTTSLDEDGDIREVRLTIGERPITLLAGEFYEQFDGTLTLTLGDESVLVFDTEDGVAWAKALGAGRVTPDVSVSLQ
jgi:hypothetical protein